MRFARFTQLSLVCISLAAAARGAAAMQDPQAPAAGSASEMAQKLSNPVADLISLPFQFNYVDGIGPQDASRFYLNFQPVIPISISEDWNVISRTIVPLTMEMEDAFLGVDSGSGLGDVLQSFFFSPKEPTERGLIWGAGPVLLLPTATEDSLGADQWAIGPTAVGLKQRGPWTYGVLGNHLWGFRHLGSENHPDVNATFVQPFVAYTTPTAWTFSLNSETTYDWEASEMVIPINALVSKLMKLGSTPIQYAFGLTYFAEDSDTSPEGFGFRFVVTPLLPK